MLSVTQRNRTCGTRDLMETCVAESKGKACNHAEEEEEVEEEKEEEELSFVSLAQRFARHS